MPVLPGVCCWGKVFLMRPWRFVWQLRWPRVVLAATVGASLSLGGLVFQALLRNPLAEPYILGVSGGSAVGAILGILAGFSLFPGLTLSSFVGSLVVLMLVLLLSQRREGNSDSLLLGGVMVNAFCGAIIMFLISVSKTVQMQKIIFWLMGDLSSAGTDTLPLLLGVLPCFLLIFVLAQPLNLLLTGRESASSMGVNVSAMMLVLLLAASLMVIYPINSFLSFLNGINSATICITFPSIQ